MNISSAMGIRTVLFLFHLKKGKAAAKNRVRKGICPFGLCCVFFIGLSCPSPVAGAPFPAAGGAAEDAAPVGSIRHGDGSAAVAAAKRINCGGRADMLFFRMLPVQPFAAGRAELRPFVLPVCHRDGSAAAQTAERSEDSSCRSAVLRRPFPMAVGILAAMGAAVLLRLPPSCKFPAADRTDSLPLHTTVLPLPAWQ